jgi:hypothetical protein
MSLTQLFSLLGRRHGPAFVAFLCAPVVTVAQTTAAGNAKPKPTVGIKKLATVPPLSFIGSDSMRLACKTAKDKSWINNDAQKPTGKIARFCALPDPLTDPGAWGTTPVPDVASVVLAARGQSPDPTSGGVVGEASDAGATLKLTGLGTAALPDQGTIIIGATQFIVGRAKEEATTFLINKFANDLCDETLNHKFSVKVGDQQTTDVEVTGSVKTFLPATCALLATGKADAVLGAGYGLPSWGVVQVTLNKDIDILPDTVIGRFRTYASTVLGGITTNATFRPPAERVTALIGAGRFGASYLHSHSASTAFREAANDMLAVDRDMCNSHADPPPDAKSPCVPWKEMAVARSLIGVSLIAGSVAASDAHDVNAGKLLLDSLVRSTAMAVAVNVNSNSQSNGETRSAFVAFAGQTFQPQPNNPLTAPFSVDKFVGFAKTLVTALIDAQARAETAIAAAQGDKLKVATAYTDALVGEAGQMVFGLDSASGTVIVDQTFQLFDRVTKYPSLRVSKNYAELVADVMTLGALVAGDVAATDLQNVSFPPGAIRVVQFAVDGAQAKTANDFQTTLSAYAAPADGFMRKRTRHNDTRGFYWTVNSYLGWSVGTETADGHNLTTRRNDRAHYQGLAIPIGFEFGLSVGGAIGILAQVADVGQVASWRSHQQDTVVKTTPPGLTFASVFAPGVNAVWNLPFGPVAIGGGYNRSPQFRDLTTASTDPSRPKADVWRLRLFAAIDVPLFP